jgi:bacteriorhodopsin
VNSYQRAQFVSSQADIRMHGALHMKPPRWNWWHVGIGAALITLAVVLIVNERWVWP